MRKVWMGLVVMAGVMMGLGGVGFGDVKQPDPGRTKNSESLRAVFKGVVLAAEKSTVQVQAMDAEKGKEVQVALGTVVGADGFVLTKASEVVGREKLQAMVAGKAVAAKVVGVSEKNDLAMLKVEATGLTAVTWDQRKNVEVGEWVASAGAGEDGEPVAVGVVSVGRRKISGRSGFLGVALADAEGKGAKIEQVVSGSAAEKAGIKVDDVVMAVNGREVKSGDDLKDRVHDFRPGDVVVVTVKRGEKVLDFNPTLGATVTGGPISRFSMMNMMGGALSRRATDFGAVFQHDTVLRPVDCGGPLVDLSGKVIGVNIARAGRTESYALPADVIVPLIAELESGKLAPAATRESAGTRPAEKATTRAKE